MIFDTHAHYDDERFDEDRFGLLSEMPEKDVGFIINCGADLESSAKSVDYAERFPFIYAACGIHPSNVDGVPDSAAEELKSLCRKDKVVAIGETGLDYHYDYSEREDQKRWLYKHIDLAAELNLPIVIHDREAHEDIMQSLRYAHAKGVTGVVHCFSGSVEMMTEVIKLGFYISLGGAVTFKNAKKVLQVAEKVPTDKLLLETDCPYMTPEPFRGKRNDSSYIKYTAQKIAEIRGLTYSDVCGITAENAKRLFF